MALPAKLMGTVIIAGLKGGQSQSRRAYSLVLI